MPQKLTFKIPAQERFEASFVPEPNSGCWLWIGYQKNDYGAFRIHGKQEMAHRASWILHRGAIPEEMRVLHKCDVPLCVNPDHLFLGTQAENMRDCYDKGRGAWSVKKGTGWQKFDNNTILQILRSTERTSSIAKKFDCSTSYVRIIRRGVSARANHLNS